MYALIALAVVLIAWGCISARAARYSLTTPIALLAAGAILGAGTDPVVEVDISAGGLRLLIELTLAVILFSDATDISLRAVRRAGSLPRRLLGIGFPLTVAAGFLVGIILFPSADRWVVALIAAALAATDAGLAAVVIRDQRVPRDLRTALNLESGLNDGLATPLVLLFLAAAVAAEAGQGVRDVVLHTLTEIVIAVAVGIAIGGAAAWLLRTSRLRSFGTSKAARIAYLALAVLAFETTHVLHGNGFVAAFVAGLAVRAVDPKLPEDRLQLSHDTVSVLSAGVWFVFGTLIPRVLANELTWRVVLYAVLSLTLVRIVPVALSLLGLNRTRRETLFLGWIGPRGLASIVFALIALEQLTGASANLVSALMTAVIMLSVLAHGLSAGPIVDAWPPAGRARDAGEANA